MKLLIAAALCSLVCACAPGYTASDVKEGAEQDVQQIETRFDQDVKGTEKMFEDADKDMDKLADKPVHPESEKAKSAKSGAN